MSKSAVLVFAKDQVQGSWKWGDHDLPTVSEYTYLGVGFTSNGAWDAHIRRVLDKVKKKVTQCNQQQGY